MTATDTDASATGRLTRELPIGLALVRDAEVLGAEPFFHELIAGIERVLVPRRVPVMLQVVATIAEAADRMRAWVENRQVQAAILIDLLPGDERVALVEELGLPTVVVGDPASAGGLTSVWTQDDVAMRDVVLALAAGGHQRLGHVAGPAQMAHTIIRRDMFLETAQSLGLRTFVFDGDYSEAAGARAIAAVATQADRPTAIVFDNDLMALGALGEARSRGIGVPDDLSLIAWDDSALCQLADPPVSAVSHDVQALGELVGRTFVDLLSGGPRRAVTAPPAQLVLRASIEYINY